MNNLLCMAEEIVEQRITRQDKNYGLLVLCCYGLLSKFGERYEKIVKNVLLRAEFHVDEKSLSQLLTDGKIEIDNIYNGHDIMNCSVPSDALATSFQGDYLYFKKNGRVVHEKVRPQVFCSTLIADENSCNTLLNLLIHELSHLVKSSINCIKKDCYNFFEIRNGLSTLSYHVSHGEAIVESKNETLDEVINVLQTTEIMACIKKLNKDGLNPQTLEFFNKLDIDTLDRPVGYEYAVRLVEELWKNERFKNSIEDNIVTGDIERIEDDFNQTTRSDLFNDFSRYLDMVDENYDNPEIVAEASEIVVSIAKIYQLNEEKVVKTKS